MERSLVMAHLAVPTDIAIGKLRLKVFQRAGIKR